MERSTHLMAAIFTGSALLLGTAVVAADTPAAKTSAEQKAAQRGKDLEHDMVQADGVNHPREIVKKDAAKAPRPAAAPAKKTQRDLDLEHDMVQGEGVRHPRQKVTEKTAPKAAAPAAAKKTQADLDREHERSLSDGTYHPREQLKK